MSNNNFMDVLTHDVRKFLAEINLGTPEAFLDADSADVAKKYTEWRIKNNKPALRQDPTAVISSWKQGVMGKIRAAEAAKANAEAKAQAALQLKTLRESAAKAAKAQPVKKTPTLPPAPKTRPNKQKAKAPIGPNRARSPNYTKELLTGKPFGPPQIVKAPHMNDGKYEL